MSLSLKHRTAWISALLSFFMVLILPACVVTMLKVQRAMPGTVTSSANLNEEERHEDDQCETEGRDLAGRRPPPPPASDVVAVRVMRAAVPPTPTLVASVAPVLEPSVFSVRRLI